MPTAVIAGALGVTGRALLEYLEDKPDWDIVALSRRTPDFETRAQFIPVDLSDAATTKAALGGLTQATHIFHTALKAGPSVAEEIAPNVAMLANLLDALEPAAELQHVQLMHGAKWYGTYLGTYKTPAREDNPRPIARNFYHAQQDWLAERQEGKSWNWSALRPHGVWGFSTGSEMNLLTGIALYASITKHLGLPLRWPGKPGNFTCIYNMIDVSLLAEAMVWAATTPAAANQAFNMTNGDYIRWNQLWPHIAAFFGLETGPVQTVPIAAVMADKGPVWDEIVAAHGLRPYKMTELVNWRYLDMALGNEFDQMSSMTKARQAGWTGLRDTEYTITDQLQRLRDAKILP